MSQSWSNLFQVGASFSAHDIAIQGVKYGCKSVIITYKTNPTGMTWPKEITERPLLTKIDGKMVHFSDGSEAEVDVIILCTGYLYHYPFMEESLRLRCDKNTLYPPDLYKASDS